jgi:hypothetical protein
MFKLNHPKCAIYRGVGGAGEANDDATLNAVTEKAQDAATSASEAATSATSAASSATTATTKASEASTSATNAATSASSASTSATAAAGSATSAASSATTATTKASEASTSATNAATSATAAASSATSASGSATTATTKASEAATSAGVAALNATSASNSASSASTSATNAAASETAAAASESAASTSESNAASSATSAASSATTATTQASNASTSATAAAASATAAAASESTVAANATAAAASETAAAASESAAAASESAAAASESAASTSETNAANSASSASTSASQAATSATSAATSATNAAASYDSFDDRYLGAKASDPSVDNDGDALITGALYFDSTNNVMKVYDGAAWGEASSSISGIKQDFLYTATSGQTAFSGADDNAVTMVIDRSDLLSVFLNGVRLIETTDYTVNTSTNTVTLVSGATTGDTVEMEVFGNFAGQSGAEVNITGGQISGLTSLGVEGNATFGDNNKAIFGAGSDLQIYHSGAGSYITDVGTGSLVLRGTNLYLQDAAGAGSYLFADAGGAVTLYYNNASKLATTSTGIDVTGTVTADGLTVDGVTKLGFASAPTWDTNSYLWSESGVGLNLDGYNLKFNTGLTRNERMRIDSSGNLLVGKTVTTFANNGVAIKSDGEVNITRNNNVPLYIRRNTSDGDIVRFWKDGTTVGSIGTRSGDMYLGTGDTNIRFNDALDRWIPANSDGSDRDNVIDLGQSNARFDDIYATNGTIQTSDRNEKQDIEELSEAEQRVAVACKGLMRKFRWKDAVAEKGDNARIHFGIIAQDLQDAFAAEGLDAGKYAMFISSTWWETQTEVPAVEAVEAQDAVYDDEGNLVSEAVEAVEAQEAYIRTDTYDTAEEAPEGATERTRLGVRYPELLAFIIAAI